MFGRENSISENVTWFKNSYFSRTNRIKFCVCARVNGTVWMLTPRMLSIRYFFQHCSTHSVFAMNWWVLKLRLPSHPLALMANSHTQYIKTVAPHQYIPCSRVCTLSNSINHRQINSRNAQLSQYQLRRCLSGCCQKIGRLCFLCDV